MTRAVFPEAGVLQFHNAGRKPTIGYRSRSLSDLRQSFSGFRLSRRSHPSRSALQNGLQLRGISIRSIAINAESFSMQTFDACLYLSRRRFHQEAVPPASRAVFQVAGCQAAPGVHNPRIPDRAEWALHLVDASFRSSLLSQIPWLLRPGTSAAFAKLESSCVRSIPWRKYA